MYSRVIATSAILAALNGLAAAQTFTDCNPMQKTCPSDPALGTTIDVDFTQGASDFFTLAEGTALTYDSSLGAVFTIASEGQAPTITSTKYIMFGNIELVIRAATGTGIVTSFVLQSDDLDEIDWEWFGGDTTQVETNYFGKGNTTTYDRATYPSVSTPQSTFHTYTIDWTAERLVWSVDGAVLRTLNYGDANGGQNYPQTPMMIKIGTWDGGAADEATGTVEWAGGYTDFSQAPFIAYVQSVKITDYSTGATSYTYGDMSGSYESIEINKDGSSSSGSSSSKAASSTTATTSKAASSTTASTTTSASANSTTTSTTSSVTVASNSTMSSTTLSTASSTVHGAASTTSSAAASSSSAAKSDSSKSHSFGMVEGVVCIAGIFLGYLVM